VWDGRDALPEALGDDWNGHVGELRCEKEKRMSKGLISPRTRTLIRLSALSLSPELFLSSLSLSLSFFTALPLPIQLHI
jgi:hypothetical protein